MAPDTRRPALHWLALVAILAGIVGGFGAFIFRILIGFFHNLSFRQSVSGTYDANVHTDATSPVWLPLVALPVAALAVTWMVRNFAPEAKGHGVPEVLDAIYYKGAHIRPIVVLVKALASSITIGSGGSAGREGPIVQIGSAFGSLVGGILGVGRGDRTILLAAGAGAGIAATFNAPLGGVLFAVELFLLRLNARSIGLVALAVVAASFVGRLLMGPQPSFNVPSLQWPDYVNEPVYVFLAFATLGVIVGLFSILFIRGVYWAEDLIERIPLNEYIRNALGMAVVGGLLFAVQARTGHYYVEGVGYATIMDILNGALSDPLLLRTLAALKLTATCMTIGFGGSGGIFSPSLVMGGCLGAGVGLLIEAMFPGLGVRVPIFALVGMAAMAGATTGAFFASIVMLTEMSGDSAVVVPVMLGTSVAWLVRQAICKPSIYNLKLLRRGRNLPESYPSSLLPARTVADVMVSVPAIRTTAASGIDGTVITLGGEQRLLGVPDEAGKAAVPGARLCLYAAADPHEDMASALARATQEGAEVIVVDTPDSDGRQFVISDAELSADYRRLLGMTSNAPDKTG